MCIKLRAAIIVLRPAWAAVVFYGIQCWLPESNDLSVYNKETLSNLYTFHVTYSWLTTSDQAVLDLVAFPEETQSSRDIRCSVNYVIFCCIYKRLSWVLIMDFNSERKCLAVLLFTMVGWVASRNDIMYYEVLEPSKYIRLTTSCFIYEQCLCNALCHLLFLALWICKRKETRKCSITAHFFPLGNVDIIRSIEFIHAFFS